MLKRAPPLLQLFQPSPTMEPETKLTTRIHYLYKNLQSKKLSKIKNRYAAFKKINFTLNFDRS